MNGTPWVQRIMWIAWPAFLAACALELVVFAFADPGHLPWPRQAVYTAAFFSFWVISLGACWLTTLLRMTPAEVNECPFDPEQRPEGCPGRC